MFSTQCSECLSDGISNIAWVSGSSNHEPGSGSGSRQWAAKGFRFRQTSDLQTSVVLLMIHDVFLVIFVHPRQTRKLLALTTRLMSYFSWHPLDGFHTKKAFWFVSPRWHCTRMVPQHFHPWPCYHAHDERGPG